MPPRFWEEPSDDDKSLYDPLYICNRDSQLREDVREFVDGLWAEYEPYCGDPAFLDEMRRHFNQFTWQMYVGVCLLRAGHALERASPEGPDHVARLNGRRTAVECIAPTSGTGPNLAERTVHSRTETEGGSFGMFTPPPPDAIQARLTSAVFDKVKQHRKWVRDGIVSPDDPFVIAIGAGMIDDTDLVRSLPHIVRAMFGLAKPQTCQTCWHSSRRVAVFDSLRVHHN